MNVLTLPDEALTAAVQKLPPNELTNIRKRALARFLERGFPTTRQEDWKYTDLRTVADIGRRWLEQGITEPESGLVEATVADIRASIDAYWIVIANGRVSAEAFDTLPDAVALSTLSSVALSPGFDMPLADLNAALLDDGLHIAVSRDLRLDKPVGLLVADGADERPGVTQTRISIDVAAGAELSLIEYHVSVGSNDQYANSIVETVLAEDAKLDHVRIQDRRRNHTQTHRTNVSLAERSTFHYGGFDIGGRLVRNDLHIDLAGSEADAAVAGLYVAADGQHIDNHARIDHRVGPSRSSQEFRGVLSGKCRCVWNGKAIVQPGADGTDAEQGNHNLLLSDDAEIDAKPELEIYADEVKCSHGTTVGQLDEDALFYLRSRGLDLQEATNALTHAFGASVINRVADRALRKRLADMIEERLSRIAGGADS